MNEQQKQKIIDMVMVDKKPLKTVASDLFISESQLKLLFKAWGVELPKKRKHEIVVMPPREELMIKYNELGTTPALASHYKVGVNTVNRWLNSSGIPTKKLTRFKTDEEKLKFLEAHLEKLNNISL